MKAIILGGFLGSGKTSLLLQLAPFLAGRCRKDPAVVVLENEISITDVDTKLLKSQKLTVRNLAAGCICCTSSAALPDSIAAIRQDFNPDYIIIEATGMAYPDAIRDIVENQAGLDTKVAVLADASRWEKLSFAMPDFVKGQLNRADVILLNKIDLVSEEKVSILAEMLKKQTHARLCPVSLLVPLDLQLLALLQ